MPEWIPKEHFFQCQVEVKMQGQQVEEGQELEEVLELLELLEVLELKYS